MSYLGEEIPKLGFGLLRLPRLADETVDLEQTIKMVDLFMENGFTYYDTARGYKDSEVTIRKALVDRYPRESYVFADKCAAWMSAKNAEEAKQEFYTSLEVTGVGYFDYYMLHNVGSYRTKVFDDYGMWDFIAERKAEGLIKHIGCSIHDEGAFVDEILTKHPDMEYVQLQLNYMDWEDAIIQSRLCYEAAMKHGKPVIVMEPLKGGSLNFIPDTAKAILNECRPDMSVASWAIRFAASLPGIITVLSGMSTLEQMQDNISYMKEFEPLSDEERAALAAAIEEISKVERIPCTACRYCEKVCPQQIPIADIIAVRNTHSQFNYLTRSKGIYGRETRNKAKGSDCIKCGACVRACPQKINVVETLEEIVALFE